MEFSDSELEAYLDESLDSAQAAELEQAVRSNPQLLRRLSLINSRRDAGIHTLGEIWRRNQVGVPTVEEMKSHLSGKLNREKSEYIEFRIRDLKCVFTLALLHDVKSENDDGDRSKSRRQKIYDKSADLLELRKKKKNKESR